MKKIECFLKEEKLGSVVDSLRMAGVPGLTVTRVEGFGKERLVAEPYLKPKVKLEIYADDKEVDNLVEVLVTVGRSGKIGDGKIAVLDVENLVRVRTGEQYADALY